jgi:glutamate racemase
MHAAAQAPIGVFDSGIGGLSVLQALQAELPHERFVYVADSAHAPYGERGDAFVAERTHAIADYLVEQHHIKALVVACNTATAAAIHEARLRLPLMPVVGIEPALKPALAHSQTRRIGVIGTHGTLGSAKFAQLLASVQADGPGRAEFVIQPCKGLAQAIELSTARALDTDPTQTEVYRLCAQYTRAMGRFGKAPGQIDTLVLGCTHYVFAADALRQLLGPDVTLLATGEPVARQTRRLLEAASLLASAPHEARETAGMARSLLLTSGAMNALQAAALRWLQLPASACALALGLR